jgi:hypothetical protein
VRDKPERIEVLLLVIAALLIIVAIARVASAEPRPIHEGINGPAGGPFDAAVRGEQVQVNPPPPTNPPRREWTGAIPSYYGNTTGCSQANATLVAHAMWDVSANDQQVYRMLNIISRESGCDSSAYNGNRRTGDDSFGFCQLNSLAGFFRSGGILEDYNRWSFADDPRHNAQACAALYARCGFGPWVKGDYGCRKP